jgi:hypothetical protein
LLSFFLPWPTSNPGGNLECSLELATILDVDVKVLILLGITFSVASASSAVLTLFPILGVRAVILRAHISRSGLRLVRFETIGLLYPDHSGPLIRRLNG